MAVDLGGQQGRIDGLGRDTHCLPNRDNRAYPNTLDEQRSDMSGLIVGGLIGMSDLVLEKCYLDKTGAYPN
jgi:hypothetical protein